MQANIIDMISRMQLHDSKFKKIRVGTNQDGGYVIPNDFTDIGALISIGIGGDVSFDLHFAKMGLKVFQFDHTVDGSPVPHENFVFNKLGLGQTNIGWFVTIDKIVNDFCPGNKDLILKFDIESAEWDAFQNVSAETMSRFRIIVCELHNFQLLSDVSNFSKMNSVIKLLTKNHTAIHMHPNNACGVSFVEGIVLPNLIEIAFLRNDRSTFTPSSMTIPSELDYPVFSQVPEMILTPFHMPQQKNEVLNLAFGKQTSQSSILDPKNYDTYGACNGRLTGQYGFCTELEDRPWWQVDLRTNCCLSRIDVYNRLDIPERSRTLTVLLSNDSITWTILYSNDKNNIFGGADGQPLRINANNATARYVRLQLADKEFFHLDEVQIFGKECA